MSPYVQTGPKSSTALSPKPTTTGSFSVCCQSVSAVCLDLQPWPTSPTRRPLKSSVICQNQVSGVVGHNCTPPSVAAFSTQETGFMTKGAKNGMAVI